MFLLSWTGRGWVVYAMLIGVVLLAVGAESLRPGSGPPVVGAGLLALGVACLVLGRAWNRDGPIHNFCGMRLQRWVWVFAPLGWVLVMPWVAAGCYA